MSNRPPRTIPDLRNFHNQEFTLEHCSTLLEKGAQIFPDQQDLFQDLDTKKMCEQLCELLPANQLSELFETEFGQGVILGLFFANLIQNHESEFEDEEYY